MTNQHRGKARLGVDIGGTFTDVALEHGETIHTAKILTTPDAPERGVLTAIGRVLQNASIAPGDVGVMIYGTTLATNLLIERKGAKTALVTTEGFRDSVEIRNENRYEQYDVNIDLPEPLVPRRLRLPVTERISATGRVLVALDPAEVDRIVPLLEAEAVESVYCVYCNATAGLTNHPGCSMPQLTCGMAFSRQPVTPTSRSKYTSSPSKLYRIPSGRFGHVPRTLIWGRRL